MKTIIMILVFAVAVFLQVFLSKKKDKRLGLILPGLGILFAVTRIFTISITQNTTVGQAMALAISTFLLSNIPTIILITIYVGLRGKLKKDEELEKINLQDTE